MSARPQYSLAEKRLFAAGMRDNPTTAEAVLWECLRGKQLGYLFRRQITMYGFIVDFWCPGCRLAIEVDGSSHDNFAAAMRDDDKDRAFERNLIGLLRFTNDEVLGPVQMVLENIKRECEYRRKLLFKGFALPTRLYTSSSSRLKENPVNNSQPNAVNDDSPTPPRWKSGPPTPLEQRITQEEFHAMTRKVAVLSRQRAMDFGDERPAAEKAFEQRYRLNEFLKAKQQSIHPSPEKLNQLRRQS